jgi:hypothetical protein
MKIFKKRWEEELDKVVPELNDEVKNAPMFMLCFMMTNTSSKAQALASKLVKAIISSAEKI